MIKVNGKIFNDIEGMKVSDFLTREGYRIELVAVEYNGSILPKTQYVSKIFIDGDAIEVVSFVGGG